MKTKHTVSLLAVVAAVAAFIHFYEKDRKGTSEQMQSGRYVTQFNADDIQEITIKDRETSIQFKKEGGSWMITEPVADRADSSVVSAILTTFEGLPKDRSIPLSTDKDEAKKTLKEFGLTNAKLSIHLTGGEKPILVSFGNDTAVEGKIYAHLDDSQEVAVVSNMLRDQLGKQADDFRDRKLSTVSTDKVERVVIKTSAGEIELKKDRDAWNMVRPIGARGDTAVIGNIINGITNARIETFVSNDKSDLNAYGLNEPRGTISLFAEGDNQPDVLEIGPETGENSGKVYARFAKRNSIYMLPKGTDAVLQIKPNDLRDRNLVRVLEDAIDMMTIETSKSGTVKLVRDKEDWKVRGSDKTDLKGNKTSIGVLLSRLRGEQVKEFVADTASELPKYGLDKPALKLTVSSYASENVPEAGAGEHPIATILFGKTEDDLIYAKLKDEPFVVSVDPALAKEIDHPALHWKDPVIFAHKAAEISAIDLTKEDGRNWKLEKDPAGKWKIAAGGGEINEINAASITNTLANLRALEWVGLVEPNQGFDKPRLKIAFKAGAMQETVEVGGVTVEGWFYAKKGNEVFLLSTPDYSSLNLPVAAEPSPDKNTPASTPSAR